MPLGFLWRKYEVSPQNNSISRKISVQKLALNFQIYVSYLIKMKILIYYTHDKIDVVIVEDSDTEKQYRKRV